MDINILVNLKNGILLNNEKEHTHSPCNIDEPPKYVKQNKQDKEQHELSDVIYMQLKDKQNYIQQQKADLSGCLSLQLIDVLYFTEKMRNFVG